MPAPEPAEDFVRFQLFVKQPADFTPGEVARLTGLDPDHIGLITVEAKHILIDVHKNHKQAARAKLVEVGGCKLLVDRELQWRWLYLNIGRNHGLTMRKLRGTLEGIEAQPVGRIHLNNNFTVIGLREDRFDAALPALTGKAINGVTLQPREASRGESRGGDPRYFQREERARRQRS